MCGKFTALYSWRDVHTFSQPLTATPVGSAAGSNDSVVTYRPMDPVPVVVWDHAAGERRVVLMRWGFPHRSNPNRPDPIHARAESIDERGTFREAFTSGQRGIVVFQTFNEGKEIGRKTEQWVIDPGDGEPRGFAFLWRRFEPKGVEPFVAAVMCTVPASALLRREIMPDVEDPRMPAILADEDWSTWLGETGADQEQVKAVLRTTEGVHWRTFPEPKGPKAPRAPVPVG